MSLFIVRPEQRLKLERRNEPRGLTLISDLHIGASNVNYEAIQADLDEAIENGDRILINGDILDLILPTDSKRYSPDNLHPKLQGRRDVLSAAIELAADILGPYASSIDMIGMGNHEEYAEKWHHVDPTMMLIDKLHTYAPTGHTIAYGGYTGFIDYRVSYPHSGGRRFVIYYHHGNGKAVMTAFKDKGSWVDSDVVWLGHKHERIANSTPLRMRCPEKGDSPVFDPQVMVMSGGYMNAYTPQSQESVRSEGRKTSYAATRGLAPQASGGVRLLLSCHGSNKSFRIRVVQ